MKLYFYIIGILCFMLSCSISFGANYVLGYSSVDEREIRWGGSTSYSSFFANAVSTWNSLSKVLIAPDTIYTYEDLHISDTSLNGVGWYGRWVPSYGTDVLQLNTAQMQLLSSARKQGVIAHELGHALGLEHHDLWDNVMYFQTTSKTSLGTQDIADYKYIYK